MNNPIYPSITAIISVPKSCLSISIYAWCLYLHDNSIIIVNIPAANHVNKHAAVIIFYVLVYCYLSDVKNKKYCL